MLILYRRPINERPATTPGVRISKAAVKADLKKKIGRELVAEPFSKWRANQLKEMKNRAAFPTQSVWYVRATLPLKASNYAHSDLTNGPA
jgi:hypothetical protein